MPAPVQNNDTAGKSVALLTDRFRSQTTIPNILRALSTATQELENALLALFSLRTLKGATLYQLPQTNAVLDVLGRVVGQPRGGVSDAVLQALIFLRVAVNRSTGRVTDVSRFAAILMRTAGGPVEYHEAGPAGRSYHLFVGAMTLPSDAVAGVISQAHVNGEQVNNFAYSTWPDGNDFEWADANSVATTGQGTWGDTVAGVVGGLLVASFGV